MNRRRFVIKLGGTLLLAAGMMGMDKLPIFEPQYSPVVMTKDDVLSVREFWETFNIEMPDMLNVACTNIENSNKITPKLQYELKIALLKAIVKSPCQVFSEPEFAMIKDDCESELQRLRR